MTRTAGKENSCKTAGRVPLKQLGKKEKKTREVAREMRANQLVEMLDSQGNCGDDAQTRNEVQSVTPTFFQSVTQLWKRQVNKKCIKVALGDEALKQVLCD